jgi:hypothetical protein
LNLLTKDHEYEPDMLEVRISELLVATPEGADALISDVVPDVLRLLREHLKMDVVFVSEFVDNRRVFRRVDTGLGKRPIEVGQSDPLEESFCQRVIDGRLPRMVANTADHASRPTCPRHPSRSGHT